MISSRMLVAFTSYGLRFYVSINCNQLFLALSDSYFTAFHDCLCSDYCSPQQPPTALPRRLISLRVRRNASGSHIVNALFGFQCPYVESPAFGTHGGKLGMVWYIPLTTSSIYSQKVVPQFAPTIVAPISIYFLSTSFGLTHPSWNACRDRQLKERQQWEVVAELRAFKAGVVSSNTNIVSINNRVCAAISQPNCQLVLQAIARTSASFQ